MSEPSNFAQAFYQGAWLPCRILKEDVEAGTVLVGVSDRTGFREVWLQADQVRVR